MVKFPTFCNLLEVVALVSLIYSSSVNLCIQLPSGIFTDGPAIPVSLFHHHQFATSSTLLFFIFFNNYLLAMSSVGGVPASFSH